MEWLKANWIMVLVVAIAAFVLWSTVGRGKKKAPGEAIQINVKCSKCRWQGTVSRYNRVCPKCAGTNLQTL